RRDHPGPAADYIDAQPLVALRRIMWFNSGDCFADSRHCVAEVEIRHHRLNAVSLAVAGFGEQTCSAEQSFGRDAPGIEAVATHFMLIDQRNTGLYRGCDVGRHEPGRACTDDRDI